MTGAELIFSCKPTQLTWFISYTIQPTEMSQKYEIEYASGMRATAAMKQTGDWLIASTERQVTIIPLTRGLLSGGR